MKLSDLNINKPEYASPDGIYFSQPKTKLEIIWQPDKQPETQDKFQENFLNSKLQLENLLYIYQDSYEIPIENNDEQKIYLKNVMIDELLKIIKRGIVLLSEAFSEESSVWNDIERFKYLGLFINNGNVYVGNSIVNFKYDHNIMSILNRANDDNVINKSDIINTINNSNIIDSISNGNNRKIMDTMNNNNIIEHNNIIDVNRNIIKTTVEYRNYNSTYYYTFNDTFNIEIYLEFLKIKMKCKNYDFGNLKISIESIINNNTYSDTIDIVNNKKITNSINNTIDNNHLIAKFVFECIINDINIENITPMILKLIIKDIINNRMIIDPINNTTDNKYTYYEYNNEIFYISKDIFRIKIKENDIIVYKNEELIDL